MAWLGTLLMEGYLHCSLWFMPYMLFCYIQCTCASTAGCKFVYVIGRHSYHNAVIHVTVHHSYFLHYSLLIPCAFITHHMHRYLHMPVTPILVLLPAVFMLATLRMPYHYHVACHCHAILLLSYSFTTVMLLCY